MSTTAVLFTLLGLFRLNDAVVQDLNDFDETGRIARRQLASLFTEFQKVMDKAHVPDGVINNRCIFEDISNMRDVRDCAEAVMKNYMHTIAQYDVFRDKGFKKEIYNAFKEYIQFMRNHRSFQLDEYIPCAGTYESMMKIDAPYQPPSPIESIEFTTPKMWEG